ncbi:MAG TPA: hypothetical protein VNH83_15775, partial [Bryobacteraceae bacterium]|nr:hypothetical protein [Bryobacteraceae bacterium]
MLASMFVLAVAIAFPSEGDVQVARAGMETAAQLSKEDICHLLVLAARKELVVTPHHTNLLE